MEFTLRIIFTGLIAFVPVKGGQVLYNVTPDQQPDEDTVEVGKPGPSPWLGELDVDDYGGSVPKLVQALGATTWSPHARDLMPGLVVEAHSLGLAVIPWTVNEPADMERAIAAGVDGLITDYPDRLRAVLESKGIPVPPPTPAR